MKAEYSEKKDKHIVLGASAGAIMALKELLPKLRADLPHSILLVIHRLKNVESRLDKLLQNYTPLKVEEVFDKMPYQPGRIYLAPADYHTLIERDLHFSLSVSELVNYSRPSIDEAFFSYAEAFKENCIGIVLTGANADGTEGLKHIMQQGGTGIIQNPEEASVPYMPTSALKVNTSALKYTLKEIATFINEL